ncbi:hypothetical protein HL658_33640 [Azospirillum sp. RWY-5-1]|uniref:Phytanoyl-CoA dioxygenase n=1 Tax=Azospirillum oleiclasticum TaxID=2735135 RepID=A0ABX2TN77_9PROT|nr:phytanoyl-CoA dioxygenase family protein [Azospirillum oleiclasticum]NYZ17512.1 hypothetical protein [Azospirillum oleiclasticum]NYZ24890.1 hypothetical protein [Azospirillum oleiclasticum]
MQIGHYGNTMKLVAPEEQRIFKEDIEARGFLPTRYGTGLKPVRFDVARFDFPGEIKRLLVDKGLVRAADLVESDSLSNLHRLIPDELRRLDEGELNEVARSFYDTDAGFLAVYHRFIRDVLRPLFDGDLLFQATPTIRFHFPKPEGFAWKPRYHTDIMLGHPPQEVNVWIPCTRVFGTNSMAIAPLDESEAVLRELDHDLEALALRVQTDDAFAARIAAMSRPVVMDPGEFLLFDSRCLHATQKNETDATRISLDIRVLPVDEWRAMRMIYRGTGRRRMPFDRGHYYDQRLVSELAL